MDNAAQPNICMVIGDPVSSSLSPLLHNTGYKALGIESQFNYTAKQVTSAELPQEIASIRANGIRGVSVTIPHKVAVVALLDELDEEARAIGAVNTIINRSGKLFGKNTDWIGVLKPLQKLVPLAERKVAIIGAGGAARAACYALKMAAANVTIYNRTLDKAQAIANKFVCAAKELDSLKSLEAYDVIINTVPYPEDPADLPFAGDLFREKHIFFDMTYKPYRTIYIDEALKKKAKVIYGIEMLADQGLEQFRIFTGYNPPETEIREALLSAVK